MSTAHTASDSNFDKEVLQAEKLTLVDFWAPWCGPCRMVAPVVAAVAEKYKDQIKVVKVNTDESMNVANQYQISSIPTLAFFKGGKEVGRLIGYHPQEALEKAVSQHL